MNDKLSALIKDDPHRAGLIIAALAAIVFGVHPPASRAIYADGGNAICIALISVWARALSMTLYCVLRHEPLFPTRQDMKQAIIGGICQACSSFCITLAVLFIPGPVVIIIVFTHTLMLLFYMAWRGEIKLDFVNVASTIMALFGLTLVLDLWHAQPKAQWIGMGIAFLAAVTTASRVYVYGNQMQKRDPIAVGAENLLIAAVITLLVIFFQTPRLPASLSGDLYIILNSLSFTIGSFFMFWGISLLGAFQYSLMAKLEPIFTSLFSVLLLGEVLGLHQYLGIALVLGSLAGYQLFRQKAVALNE